MANINVYPRNGTDYSNFYSAICPTCSKVHHLYSINPYTCYAGGFPGTGYTPVVVKTDLPSADYVAIAWHLNKFVAIGPNICASTTDGQTWTARTLGRGKWRAICSDGAALAVAVGESCVASSADGVTWIIGTLPEGDYNCIGWNGTVFIALGNNCGAYSTDGLAWTKITTIPKGNWQAIVCNAGTLSIAVANGDVPNGAGNYAMTSADCITWTARAGLPAGNYYGIDFDGSSTYAVVGDSVCYTTADGVTWTAQTPGTGAMRHVRWNGSLFAAVGASAAATSPDGVTWTDRTITAAQYLGIDWNGTNLYVACGINHGAYGAAGTSWTQHAETASALATLLAGGVVET